MSKTTRLTDKHPFYQKVRKLFDIMEDMDISLGQDGMGRKVIRDKDHTVTLCDVEQDPHGFEMPMTTIPPTLEWKLCYDKEEA